ncbi:MAG: hypothetical protein ACYDHN_15050, partial [Solirubrobacteraceae bacterium]
EVEAKQQAEQEAKRREQQQREEAAALAAAALKRQEEAAAQKRHEEVHSTPTPLVALTVLKAKVVKHKLVLSLRLSDAGVVRVFGPSLKKISKSLKPGVQRLTVAIVRGAHVGHRHAVKVTVSLRTPSGAVSHTVTLRI